MEKNSSVVETLLPFCGEGMKVEVSYSGKSPWKPVDLEDQTVTVFGETLSVFKDSPPTGFQIPFDEIERVEAKDGSLHIDALWSVGKYPIHLKIRKSSMEENLENPLKPGNLDTGETPGSIVENPSQPGPLKKFMERARGKKLLFVRSGEGTGESPVTFVGVKLLFDMEGGMHLYSSASDKLLMGVCSIGEDAELSVEYGIEGEVALRWKETGRPATVNRLFAV